MTEVLSEGRELSGPGRGFERQTAVKVLVVAAIIVVDFVWIAVSDFRFDAGSAAKVVAATAFLIAVTWFYRVPRPIRKFEVLCNETALLLAFSAAAATLSYLMTSLDLPLVDGRLLAVDAALGFDWMGYVGFVNDRPWLGTIFSAAYVTTLAQVALTVIVLGLAGRLERVRHFVSAVMLGALICIVVSAVLPSAGALGTLRPPTDFVAENQPIVTLDYKQVFFDLRSGAGRFISLDSLHGLIAFPSYHCTLSALVVIAFAGAGWWFWPVLGLNLIVVLSTPVDGGHHLTDALGGILVALASWRLVRTHPSIMPASEPLLVPAIPLTDIARPSCRP
jgi:membrane-associated phospholipid phosphatase